MAGEIKVLYFSQGTEVLSMPITAFFSGTGLATYANDAAYLVAKGAAATEGDAYGNTTDHTIHYHDGTYWRSISTRKNNFSAIIAPVIGDDNTLEYAIGSLWINTVTDLIYVCTDATTGAAVWKQLIDATASQSLAGVITFTNTSQSTDKDTGAVILQGGLGVEKNVNIGGDLGVTGNAVITGDLTVNGTTTTINTQTLDVEDANITVNNGGTQATADANDAGITVEMSDATDARIGFDSTLASKFKAGEVGTESQVITAGHAQTMIDKTFDDEITVKEIATPTTPDAGYQKIYPKTDGLWYAKNDAGVELPLGSGGGEFNFLQYKQVTDYVTYDDGATAIPVDGTGGSPTVITVVASPSPIDSTPGVLNLRISKSAANGQGEGVAVDFTVRGKVDYGFIRNAIVQATGSANFADGDVGIYLLPLDGSSTALLYPPDQDLYASSFVSQQQFPFQLNGDQSNPTTQYRLLIHCQSVNAAAWDLDLVIKFVESKKVTGSIANWPQYNLTVTGATNWVSSRAVGIPYKTIDGSWRFKFNILGTVDSATRTTYTADISGIVFKNNATGSVILASSNASSAGIHQATTGVNNSNITVNHVSGATTQYRFYGDVELESQPTFAVDYSNQVLSEDVGSRDIIAKAYRSTSNQTLTGAAWTELIFQSEIYDLTSSYDIATGRFTAPETGYYDVDYSLSVSAGAATTGLQSIVAVNGSTSVYKGHWLFDGNFVASKGYNPNSSDILYLTKGQYISLFIYTTGGSATLDSDTQQRCYFTVAKRSTPQQIAASDKIFARYSDSSGQAFSNATVMTFNNIVEQSHGLLTGGTGTGVFKMARSGKLRFNLTYSLASIALTIGQYIGIRPRRNGGAIIDYLKVIEGTQTTALMQPIFSGEFSVNKGDDIDFLFLENIGAVNLAASGNALTLSME